jgi:deazaflavin-dependent oxidoreductase (nitroreductase family)
LARDWNQQIIEEFRAKGGRVGGRFEGLPLLLLHHRGARSGKQRVNPLAYRALEDGAMAVFASKGGAPTNPDWYHNVRANPEVEVEVDGRRIRARARVAVGEERQRIWRAQTRDVPAFAAYQERTERTIPVVILEPEK